MRALGLLVPVALAVLVAATAASGTEPTCPDGEVTRVDLGTLVSAPRFAKLLVKIGDDCFSTVLACVAHGGAIRCTPERSALLRGHVTAARGPLPGTMLTAFDDGRLESVSVFAQAD